jgi:hypothetical protein
MRWHMVGRHATQVLQGSSESYFVEYAQFFAHFNALIVTCCSFISDDSDSFFADFVCNKISIFNLFLITTFFDALEAFIYKALRA